jgi:hypothetical protein
MYMWIVGVPNSPRKFSRGLVSAVSSDPTKIAKVCRWELINVQLKRGEKRRTQT